jgi:hypothetical protein
MLLALQRPQHAPVRHRCGGWPTRLSREALGSNGSLRQIVVALADFAPRELPPPADPYLWLRTGTREMGQARVSATPTARVCPRRPAVRPARAGPPPPRPEGSTGSYVDASRPRRRRSAAASGSGSSTNPSTGSSTRPFSRAAITACGVG